MKQNIEKYFTFDFEILAWSCENVDYLKLCFAIFKKKCDPICKAMFSDIILF